MFGNNPVRKQDLRTDGTLDVQEVFYTIQGEGPSTGRPAVFIRLAGCNLRCHFCDTEFETGMENQLTVAEIMDAVLEACGNRDRYNRLLVVITGGEPMRQNIVPLVRVLEYANFEVEVETAGTLWVPGLGDTKARIICSPKTGSVNPEVYARAAAFKYILSAGWVSPDDGLPDKATQRADSPGTLARPRTGAEVFVQPMDQLNAGLNNTNVQAAVESAMRFGYRLSLQQHKIAGVE